MKSSPTQLALLLACVAMGCTSAAAVHRETSTDIDVLVVLDDSYRQNWNDNVETALSSAVGPLTAGTRWNGDPLPNVRIGSVHFGVITGDLGFAGSTDTPCNVTGDDARLLVARDGDAHCTPEAPAIITASEDSVVSAQNALACNFRQGFTGCWVVRPLDAMLAALSPTLDAGGAPTVTWTSAMYVPPAFTGNLGPRSGVGGPNDGFLRSDSELVVVMVQALDDCSAPTYDGVLADTSLSATERCRMASLAGDRLYPIDRFVDGLLGLRRDAADVLFVGIVGIPSADLGSAPHGPTDFDPILADPAMDISTRQTACEVPGGDAARPAPRLVQTAAAIEARGGRAGVFSICELTQWSTQTRAIEWMVDRAMDRAQARAASAP